MKNDRLGASVLSVKVISNVDAAMAKSLNLGPNQRSLGLITSDCDDVTYVALDEATKAAEVDVVYAKFICWSSQRLNQISWRSDWDYCWSKSS